jgi:hypothetical protein
VPDLGRGVGGQDEDRQRWRSSGELLGVEVDQRAWNEAARRAVFGVLFGDPT